MEERYVLSSITLTKFFPIPTHRHATAALESLAPETPFVGDRIGIEINQYSIAVG
jgi:hypothetical protein